MSRHTIPMGRVLGIPIALDASWFLVFVLFTWALAASYFPTEFPGWPAARYWAVAAATAVLLYVCVFLHELGHSVVALRFRTRVRSITLFIFGGVAILEGEPPSARAEFWIAIAGPVVSLALAGLFTLAAPQVADRPALFAPFSYLGMINGSLALFNLIPGFPLDGGRIFRAIMWAVKKDFRRATLIAANLGRLVAFLFIAGGVIEMLAGQLGAGLWIAAIGWFLDAAAVMQIHHLVIRGLLAGHQVAAAMNRSYVFIPGDTLLQELIDDHVLGGGRRSFVVKHGEDIVGLLTLHQMRRVPRVEWPRTTAAAAMIPLDQVKRVQPDTEIEAALEQMDRSGVNQLPVMAEGRIVGMLSRDDVISFLRQLAAESARRA
jgi:Zn-dependent protease